MELLQVFDDELNKLDESVERPKRDFLPPGKNFMIVLIFVQNEEGKYLIQKTSKAKKGVYAFTGGHVTFGDDGFITALKEVKEELGIDLDGDKLELVNVKHFPGEYVSVYYYKDNISLNDLVLQKEEVEEVYWLTNEEIDDLISKNLFRISNLEFFEIVKKWLGEK